MTAESFNPEEIPRRKDEDGEKEEVTPGVEHVAGANIDEKKEDFGSFETKTDKEYEKYRDEAERMIEGYKPLFATFAGDISLRFRVSDKFMIDFENGEVHNDARWFADKGCSMQQVLWAKLHELSHFRDFADDTDGMLSNFDEMWDKAEVLGSQIYYRYQEVHADADEETLDALIKKNIPISQKDPNKKASPVELAAYKMYHIFYNIFDDIHVNNIVSRHAPKFATQRKGGEEVARLYKEKLFKGTDYSELPRHLQFLYALLREEMVSDEKVLVNEEVAAVLSSRIAFEDGEYTPQELVEKFIKPRRGRDTTASKRYEVLESTLLPIFNELVSNDIAEWQPEKLEKKEGKPTGLPFQKEYDEFDKNSPDQLNDSDIGEWSKDRASHGGIKKEKEESVEDERAKEVQDAMNKKFCEKFHISPELFQEYRNIEEKIEPYRNELRDLWMKIVYGSSPAVRRKMVGHFEKGVEMDVEEVLKHPEILVGNFEGVPIMKKMASERSEIKQPELIRARVIVDDSASMEEGDREEMAKQVLVLVASSLHEFNAYLDYTRNVTKSKTQTDTEAWVFGSYAQRIKDQRFEEGRSFDEEQAEIIRMFGRLVEHPVGRGATCDHLALEAIEKSIDDEDSAKIAAGKLLEMLFLVTDGASLSPNQSREAVDQILEKGVFSYGFQIGNSHPEEKEVFDRVWNDEREQKLGIHVGEKIENLVPAIAYILREHMRDIRV